MSRKCGPAASAKNRARRRPGARAGDLAIGVGLLGGVGAVFMPNMIDGGNVATSFEKHAVIVILGGSLTATVIRFPHKTIAQGVPTGALRLHHARR